MNRKERRRAAAQERKRIVTFTGQFSPTITQEQLLREMMGESDSISLGPEEIEALATAQELDEMTADPNLNAELAKGSAEMVLDDIEGMPPGFRMVRGRDRQDALHRPERGLDRPGAQPRPPAAGAV
jgi:hypothetical protein